jgi:predicted metal-dependent phosphoesterase TrpH
VTFVDLHVHTSASDGRTSPTETVRQAVAAELAAIALTDHDTLGGIPEATRAAGDSLRVVTACEFSAAAPWGEVHLLAYFLPRDDPALEKVLAEQRRRRAVRAAEMVGRLTRLGIAITQDDVRAAAGDAALGRPHVARALVARGAVRDVNAAFHRYLGPGRPAFVPKALPAAGEVLALVRSVGGVSSAAHLNERGTLDTIGTLAAEGLDGVEVRHPSHDTATELRIARAARACGLLPTGGSDWHGDPSPRSDRAELGGMGIPAAWLEALEELHARRIGQVAV